MLSGVGLSTYLSPRFHTGGDRRGRSDPCSIFSQTLETQRPSQGSFRQSTAEICRDTYVNRISDRLILISSLTDSSDSSGQLPPQVPYSVAFLPTPQPRLTIAPHLSRLSDFLSDPIFFYDPKSPHCSYPHVFAPDINTISQKRPRILDKSCIRTS